MSKQLTRTTLETWTPANGIDPQHCDRCDHLHYPWKSDRKPLLAPQWTWCDESDCTCRGLWVIKRVGAVL